MITETKIGDDWINAVDLLPGRRFINDYLLVDDGNNIEVVRYGVTLPFDRPWIAFDAVLRWKKLPQGYCVHCGAKQQRR